LDVFLTPLTAGFAFWRAHGCVIMQDGFGDRIAAHWASPTITRNKLSGTKRS
jgi:hypothetical protein